MNNIFNKDFEKKENPYLLLDFWHFAIISTLMILFFPWSLLFCVFFYGLERTKLIVVALLHDAFKTFIALISGLLSIAFMVIIIFILIGYN
tara:strand:- start:2504 stop:2776 length:273 start_codon:yes stop_codon:yes gene_type:complete